MLSYRVTVLSNRLMAQGVDVTVETQTQGVLQVRVWMEGDVPERPLLYLHGFEHHPGMAPFLQRLAQGRRVYAPEHPGYGESTGMDSMEGVLDIVLHYRELLRSWGIEQVDVVGHSLGGMIGAELAAICPEIVRNLVLVNAFGLWFDEAQPPDPFVLNPEELKKAKWHDPAHAPEPEPSTIRRDSTDPSVAELARMENLGAATKLLWPIPDRGLRKRLPLISARTLILHGESDELVPMMYSEEMARLISDAQLVRIQQAGHLPMFEREDDFVKVVGDFLSA